MQIIIPMAGHSRRFQAAGYSVPKPFILIDGKPMISHVCQMFSSSDHFIFVCQKGHLQNQEHRSILENIVRSYSIVTIEPHELGPTYSALMAESGIRNDAEPVIITYCDFTQRWNYKQFCAKASQYEGAMAVFRGFHPASFGNTFYAYVRANEEMEMLELREKQSFTENRSQEFASTGVYYMDTWNRFKQYSTELLERKDKVAAEYYSSLIYNYLVRDNLKVGLFEVRNFICWGTPEDLAEYFFWSDYFKNSANQILARPI